MLRLSQAYCWIGGCYHALRCEASLHNVMQVLQDNLAMSCRLEHDCSEGSSTSFHLRQGTVYVL
ncbi:hypothetical protein PGB90_008475 [Kerria lacca]